MALLKKANIPAPVLPKETVEVPELGGEVVVRGMLLRERIDLFFDAEKNGHGHLSKVLAATVIDADGVPVYTRDEWEQFGARNTSAVLRLFEVAKRMSGLDAEAATKN